MDGEEKEENGFHTEVNGCVVNLLDTWFLDSSIVNLVCLQKSQGVDSRLVFCIKIKNLVEVEKEENEIPYRSEWV